MTECIIHHSTNTFNVLCVAKGVPEKNRKKCERGGNAVHQEATLSCCRKPLLRGLPGISAHINHLANMTVAWWLTTGRSPPKKKEEAQNTYTETTPSPTAQSSCTDPKGRKQFQPRVQALLQVLMEMNGGVQSSTG